VLLRRREDVEDAAPHRELAALLDQLDAGVGEVDEAADGGVQTAGDVLPCGERDRLEVAQAGHLRLQDAADGGHDDVERTRRRVRAARVLQPAQHGEAAARRCRRAGLSRSCGSVSQLG
jgi:hypothetical protein